MAGDRFELRIDTLEEAERTYRTGLRHGLLTFPGSPAVAVGDTVRVDLDLAFAGYTLELVGAVAHTGAVATVVQFPELPRELHEAFGGAPPPPPSLEETLVARIEPEDTVSQAREATDEFGRETMEIGDLDSLDGEMADASDFAEAPASSPGGPTGREDDGGEDRRRPARSRSFRLRVPDKDKRAARREERPRPAARAAGPGPRVAKTPDGARAPVAVERRGIPIPGRPGAVISARPLKEGSLTETSMRAVLMDTLQAGTTGVLVVEGFRERFWCFLVDGRPVRFVREPSGRAEALEFLATRHAALDAERATRARQLADLSGLAVETVLERLGYLPGAALQGVVQERARKMTERLLAVNYGSYHLFADGEIRTLFPGPAANVMQVLWERAREQIEGLTEKRVSALVDEYHEHHVVLTRDGRTLVQELRLRGSEQRFVERYLRGSWQVSALLGRLELPNRTLIELLLALRDLGIVELREDEGPGWRLARAERYLIDRMDYMDKDHFAFVEAHWSSLPGELQRACRRVGERLADPVMEQLELARVSELRKQILGKLGEVEAIFEDDGQRDAYRATRVSKDKLRMAADLFARQGEMALFKKDGAAARECFSRVLELDPGGAGSGERRARAREVLRGLEGGRLLDARDDRAEDREFDLAELDEL